MEVEERILANGNPIQFVRIRPAPAPKPPKPPKKSVTHKAGSHPGPKKRTARKK